MLVKNRELAIAPRFVRAGHMSVAVGATPPCSSSILRLPPTRWQCATWEACCGAIHGAHSACVGAALRGGAADHRDAGQDALRRTAAPGARPGGGGACAEFGHRAQLEPVEAFVCSSCTTAAQRGRRARCDSGDASATSDANAGGVLLDQEQEGIRTRVAPIPTPGVLSLSALPLGDLDESGDSGSYTTSASSWSSVSSCAGDEGSTVRIPSLSSMPAVSSASDLVQRLGIL